MDEDDGEQLGGVIYWLRRDPSAQLRVVLHADDTALRPLCALSVSKAFLRRRNVQFPLQSCHGNLLQPIRATARLALEGSEVNVAKQPL